MINFWLASFIILILVFKSIDKNILVYATLISIVAVLGVNFNDVSRYDPELLTYILVFIIYFISVFITLKIVNRLELEDVTYVFFFGIIYSLMELIIRSSILALVI